MKKLIIGASLAILSAPAGADPEALPPLPGQPVKGSAADPDRRQSNVGNTPS